MKLGFKSLKAAVLVMTVLGTTDLYIHNLVVASPLISKMPDRYEEMINKTVNIMTTPLNLQRQLEFLKSEVAMLLQNLTISASNVNLTDNPQANKEILENILKACANLNAILDGQTKRSTEDILPGQNKQLRESDIVDMYEMNAQKFVDIQTRVIKLLGRVNWLQGSLQRLVELVAADAININATVGEKEESLNTLEKEVKQVNKEAKGLVSIIEKTVDECKTLIKEAEKISEERKKNKEKEAKQGIKDVGTQSKNDKNKSDDNEKRDPNTKNEKNGKKIENENEKRKEKSNPGNNTDVVYKNKTEINDEKENETKNENKEKSKNEGANQEVETTKEETELNEKPDNTENESKGNKKNSITDKANDKNQNDKQKIGEGKNDNDTEKSDKEKINIEKSVAEQEIKEDECTCTCGECKEFRRLKANGISNKDREYNENNYN